MPVSSERLARRQRAVANWENFSAWPFLVLSLVFIVLYSVRCLDIQLKERDMLTIWAVLTGIWAVFIVDYVVRLFLAADRGSFVRHNVPDLLAALLPIFRPFRAIKELHRLRYFHRRTGAAVRARLVTYAAAFVVLWIYTIAVTEVWVERGAKGVTIDNLGDGLYWAVVTIATVGYGDMVPVTTAGRVLAMLLMASGIVIVGVTTATVVSYLNDAIRAYRRGDHDAADEVHMQALESDDDENERGR
jgi:voltage-gated potassium channel